MANEESTEKVSISRSEQFPAWLLEQNISLCFSTYQAGKMFFIGLKPDGAMSIFERTFNRCMGLWAGNSHTIYMSSRYQLWRFDNALEIGQQHESYDRLYLPQITYITGDLDIHDIGVKDNGDIIFVNTLFSCLATVSDQYSFIPLWQPPFITKLVAEDRCHLNGLAMVNDKAKYVTAVSQSNISEGWREHRLDGGIIIDVESNDIITTGLSMPHSPRWYQDRLWLHNSGMGEFGFLDFTTGKFEPVTFCPGYLRGLSFHKNFAIVGISKMRGEKQTFGGLPIEQRLEKQQANAHCAILVIDLNTGNIVHTLNIEGLIEELYDVVILPQVARPMAIGTKSDEIHRVLSIGPPA